ncbi:MAG: hypothetical protein JWN93_2829, partial [Hyphomicrobiales bacterium]|nr:hypothetical protein [Hyphomicrobiales bacterium]
KPEPAAAAPKPAAAKPPADVDPIGSLLRGSNAAPAAAADTQQAKRIVAAQRALQKLGYDVTPDGVFGAGSKAALAKFERERNLPVTGELDARTLRALGARSGVPIP